MERPILKPIGTPVEHLDTPALVVDLNLLESNIESVHNYFRTLDAKLRPYVEAHRCPAIAHKQLAAGGTVGGVSVASVGEAEVFAQNGLGDILITSEVVPAAKITRLCALANMASMSVAADNARNVRHLSEAAVSSGVRLNVLVDINAGQERSGVSAGQPAVDLAQIIRQSDGLNFAGLMCYDESDLTGEASTLDSEWRRLIQQTLDTRQMMEQQGIDVPSVSVGGTHCFEQAAQMSGVTEVLAGAYALMDHRHSVLLPQLKPAAKVLASVTSLPEPGVAILDTGRKAMGEDFGFPVIADSDDLQVVSMSAEHGKLQWDTDCDMSLELGEKVWLTPMEIGGCVNVYDYIQGVRNGRLEVVLDVAARGRYR